jgi:hypothetical protein
MTRPTPHLPVTDENRAQLRLLLDESIPEGGTDADTLFTDEEIDTLLETSQFMWGAASKGWTIKAARVMQPGALVRAQYGSENYQFLSPKELADFALKMADLYNPFGRSATGGGGGDGTTPSPLLGSEKAVRIVRPVLWGVRSGDPGEGGLLELEHEGDFSRYGR